MYICVYVCQEMIYISFKLSVRSCTTKVCIYVYMYVVGSVRPVLRGHPREVKKWLLKTGDPVIQLHLHCILGQGTYKRSLLNAGDP